MESQNYFQSYHNYFWEWEETLNGQFLTIPNGRTIAQKEHILDILDHLAEESIPPFGALLLALIATNASESEPFDKLLTNVKNKVKVLEGKQIPDIDAAISFLENLQLLTGFKKGSKRLLLFATLFSGCHNRISSEKAKIVLTQFKDGLVLTEKRPFSYTNFINDFKVFALLQKKFPNKEAILNAMQGLPVAAVEEQLEETVLEQVATSAKSQTLIEQLIQDDQTFSVGSLVKSIWSGLNIPLHHNRASSQSLGGISDLTNKGDFDKLLISEFAQDDMVFMSRIANNEALYIQREVPPEADKFERILLIDTTLKNWGNPKALNFATALAIANHPKTAIPCRIMAVGNSFEEVLFSTVSEVADGLNVVSGKLNCTEGLLEYMQKNKVTSEQELFFITVEEALQSVAVQKFMSDYKEVIQYVITTHVNGTVSIYKNQNSGKKLLQKMILPLATLWKRNETKKEKVDADTVASGVTDNYPLFFPLPQNNIAKFYLDEKYYFLTSSKSLIVTTVDLSKTPLNYSGSTIPYQSYKGTTVLFEGISIKSGGIYALGKNEVGHFILYYFYANESKFCYLNLNTKEFAKTNFGTKNVNYKFEIYTENDLCFLINKNNLEVFSVEYQDEALTISLNFEPESIEKSNAHSKIIGSYMLANVNVLRSFNSIFINFENELQFNIHTLAKNEYNTDFYLGQNRITQAKISAKRDNNKFIFPDGSEILLDKRGMLSLVSSDSDIPTIYVPPALQFGLAMATDYEFTGNDYFYNPSKELFKISTDEFSTKYLNPFIQQIVHYEA